MSPARTARRTRDDPLGDQLPSAPAPGIGFCAADRSSGGGLHRWATERFQMTRLSGYPSCSKALSTLEGRVFARRQEGRRPGFQGWAGVDQCRWFRFVCREQNRNTLRVKM
jgi:hypothetical protein